MVAPDGGLDRTELVVRLDFVGEIGSSGRTLGGCSSMVERQPSKLDMWVRFPSPAPLKSFRPLELVQRFESVRIVGES